MSETPRLQADQLPSSADETAPPKEPTVAFLIRSLEIGGAEVQLAALSRGLQRRGFIVRIFCFYARGPLLKVLDRDGVRVVSLDKRGRWDLFYFYRRLLRETRSFRPDVIYSFMGPPNLLAATLKRFVPGLKVVWGIRSSHMDVSKYDYSWRLVQIVERWLSSLADLIVANSNAGRDNILARGFAAGKICVVSNGVDTDRFMPDGESRSALRRKWCVRDDEILIGLIARLDAKKDHATFLRAVAAIAPRRDDVRFVCVGADGREDRDRLRSLAATLGVTELVTWEDHVDSIETVYPALDLCTSSSAFGEGFPNVIAEAMSAGVPCVATDVGDSARIIGDLGIIVPPRDPAALADGWLRLIGRRTGEGVELAAKCRVAIVDHFSEAAMVAKMADALRDVSRT